MCACVLCGGSSKDCLKSSVYRNVDIKTLKHEAEFFGIIPLGKRDVCFDSEV